MIVKNIKLSVFMMTFVALAVPFLGGFFYEFYFLKSANPLISLAPSSFFLPESFLLTLQNYFLFFIFQLIFLALMLEIFIERKVHDPSVTYKKDVRNSNRNLIDDIREKVKIIDELKEEVKDLKEFSNEESKKELAVVTNDSAPIQEPPKTSLIEAPIAPKTGKLGKFVNFFQLYKDKSFQALQPKKAVAVVAKKSEEEPVNTKESVTSAQAQTNVEEDYKQEEKVATSNNEEKVRKIIQEGDVEVLNSPEKTPINVSLIASLHLDQLIRSFEESYYKDGIHPKKLKNFIDHLDQANYAIIDNLEYLYSTLNQDRGLKKITL